MRDLLACFEDAAALLPGNIDPLVEAPLLALPSELFLFFETPAADFPREREEPPAPFLNALAL